MMSKKIGKKNRVSSGTFVAYATNASCLCYCGTTCTNCNSKTATATGTSIYNYVTTNNVVRQIRCTSPMQISRV